MHVGIPLPRISPEAPFRSVVDPHPDFHLMDLAGTALRLEVLKAHRPTSAFHHTMCDYGSQHLMQFQDSANEPSGKLAVIACIAEGCFEARMSSGADRSDFGLALGLPHRDGSQLAATSPQKPHETSVQPARLRLAPSCDCRDRNAASPITQPHTDCARICASPISLSTSASRRAS